MISVSCQSARIRVFLHSSIVRRWVIYGGGQNTGQSECCCFFGQKAEFSGWTKHDKQIPQCTRTPAHATSKRFSWWQITLEMQSSKMLSIMNASIIPCPHRRNTCPLPPYVRDNAWSLVMIIGYSPLPRAPQALPWHPTLPSLSIHRASPSPPLTAASPYMPKQQQPWRQRRHRDQASRRRRRQQQQRQRQPRNRSQRPGVPCA